MAPLFGYQSEGIRKPSLFSRVACLFLFIFLLVQVGCLSLQGPQNTTSPRPNEVVVTTAVPSAEPSQEAVVTRTVLPTESSRSPQERLAYLGPDRNLWIVNGDGSGQRKLTGFERGIDGHLIWSPDGQKIAFDNSEHDGTESIYVVDLREGNLVQLTKCLKYKNDLSWSPNSKELAFTGNRNDEFVLCVANYDGSGLKELFHFDLSIDFLWLPDSVHIVFRVYDTVVSYHTSQCSGSKFWKKIYTVHISDGSPTQIFQGYKNSIGDLFAIHDSKVVFSGSDDPCREKLYIADPTTGDLSLLTNETLVEETYMGPYLYLSPDRDKVACWSYNSSHTINLYVIDLPTGHTRLVESYEPDWCQPFAFAWLSDNEAVVNFAADLGGSSGVYVLSLTTGEAMLLAGSSCGGRESVNGLSQASLLDVFDNKILLRGAPEGQLGQLYFVQTDGTGLTMVARGHFLVGIWFRGWSPTGKLALEAREAGEGEEVRHIHIIGQDGQVLWKIPDGRNPVWQPSPPPMH